MTRTHVRSGLVADRIARLSAITARNGDPGHWSRSPQPYDHLDPSSGHFLEQSGSEYSSSMHGLSSQASRRSLVSYVSNHDKDPVARRLRQHASAVSMAVAPSMSEERFTANDKSQTVVTLGSSQAVAELDGSDSRSLHSKASFKSSGADTTVPVAPLNIHKARGKFDSQDSPQQMAGKESSEIGNALYRNISSSSHRRQPEHQSLLSTRQIKPGSIIEPQPRRPTPPRQGSIVQQIERKVIQRSPPQHPQRPPRRHVVSVSFTEYGGGGGRGGSSDSANREYKDAHAYYDDSDPDWVTSAASTDRDGVSNVASQASLVSSRSWVTSESSDRIEGGSSSNLRSERRRQQRRQLLPQQETPKPLLQIERSRDQPVDTMSLTGYESILSKPAKPAFGARLRSRLSSLTTSMRSVSNGGSSGGGAIIDSSRAEPTVASSHTKIPDTATEPAESNFNTNGPSSSNRIASRVQNGLKSVHQAYTNHHQNHARGDQDETTATSVSDTETITDKHAGKKARKANKKAKKAAAVAAANGHANEQANEQVSEAAADGRSFSPDHSGMRMLYTSPRIDLRQCPRRHDNVEIKDAKGNCVMAFTVAGGGGGGGGGGGSAGDIDVSDALGGGAGQNSSGDSDDTRNGAEGIRPGGRDVDEKDPVRVAMSPATTKRGRSRRCEACDRK